ncbi:MAG: ArsA family ATPase [Oculatellaceae cyanobacterium Prado106]|jgi:arsenite-transporting ATPase|nr:ArsA family ATPase [Oculatellaceae cyanobacterium Prado106]
MSRIVTFLGSVGTAQTTMAIATAHHFAQQGKRTLLITHAPGKDADRLLETTLTSEPEAIAPNLEAVQLQATMLLDQTWEEVKKSLSSYLPDSVAIDVYPSEMVLFPGFDSILAFNALRRYFQSEAYDILVYDSQGGIETLRMLGLPEISSWYFRRFQRLFEALDLSKIADSMGGPIASAWVSANLDQRKMQGGMNLVQDWIRKGVAVTSDAQRLTIYLVTTEEEGAIAQAQWLWGSAQLVDLRVSGVLAYSQCHPIDLSPLKSQFDPLGVSLMPTLESQNWQPLVDALPNFDRLPAPPPPLQVDLAQRQVQVFLPGFTKQQVKLTQMGSELTVEAGDQRRNILLPPQLQGQPVTGGKFEAPYLVISF